MGVATIVINVGAGGDCRDHRCWYLLKSQHYVRLGVAAVIVNAGGGSGSMIVIHAGAIRKSKNKLTCWVGVDTLD